MTLRDTNPQRLEALMRDVEEEWANNNGDERVQQTWRSFVQVFQLVAAIAWDIEASRGNLGDPNRISQAQIDDLLATAVRDNIASGALNRSAILNQLIDKLEAQQQIIAIENFGDDNTPTGRLSDSLVMLINCLRPISEVIQDAAADNKSSTMDRLQAIQQREQNTST